MLSDIDPRLQLLGVVLFAICIIYTIKVIIWTRDASKGIKDLNKKFDLLLKKMGVEEEKSNKEQEISC